MGHQGQLLLAGKNDLLLKEIGEELTSYFTVDYVYENQDVYKQLRDGLAFIIVDIDCFDEDLQLIRYIKQQSCFEKLPIIVLGQNDASREYECLKLGCIDYMKKPFYIDNVVHKVKNVCQLYNQCHYYLETDLLTQVYTKNSFFHQAEVILKNNLQVEYDLVCFDVDRFQLINDLYGTAAGDQLLKTIAKIYSDICHQYHWIIGRLHNDVFVMLKERHIMSYEELTILPLKDFNIVDRDIKIVLSFGVYPIHDHMLSIHTMCDRAFMTLKSIKGNYKTSYKIYQETLRQNIIDEQTMINEMEQALLNHQFVPYYQPKYNIETGNIIGFEALVRWHHPTKGIIPPHQFIPLFENNGFISKVDFYIWEQVCQDIHRLLEMGYKVMPISVNVSRIELYMNMKERLIHLLERYQIPIKLLRLEITETAYTKDPKQLIEVVSDLRSVGFTILMDDFGSGYSSLNMLKEVPVDVLKIDLNFLKDLETSGKSEKILESVLIMSRKLGLSVIAEGVETKKQIDFLRSIGCLRAQGYYYSRPVTQKVMFDTYADESILKGDTIDSPYSNFLHLGYDCANQQSHQRLWDYHIKSKRLYRSKIVQDDTGLPEIIDNVPDCFIESKIIHPDYVEGYLEFYNKVSNGKDCDYLFKTLYKDGVYKWMHITYHVLFDENGEPDRAIGFGEDVNEVYESKQKIQQEQYYEAIMHGSRVYYDVNLTEDSIVLSGENHLIDQLQEYTYSHFLDYILMSVVNVKDHQSFSHTFSSQYLMNLYKQGETLISVEYELGIHEKKWYEIDINLYTPQDSQDICAFITIRDIDERKRYELSLEFNVKHDDLTGVYTRSAIEKYVENIIVEKRIAVMMIDVNDFKLINDTFGHTYGDDTLKNIAEVLLRVIGDKGVVGRMGGDEFMIVIDKFKDTQDILHIANRINDSIHLSYIVDFEKYTLSCSIGIAYSDEYNNSFHKLYHLADQKLYSVKKREKKQAIR